MNLEQYHSRENTPLKFHTFIRYIALPLGMLLDFASLVKILSFYDGSNVLIFDLLFSLSHLALLIATFVGFFSWKPYSWYTLMSAYGLALFYRLYAIILYVSYDQEVGTLVGQLIGTIVWAVIIGIYYYKRKPLFVPQQEAPSAPSQTPYTPMQNNQPTTHVTPPQAPQYHTQAPQYQSQAKINFCRQCGAKIIEGSSFCNKCGSRLNWN